MIVTACLVEHFEPQRSTALGTPQVLPGAQRYTPKNDSKEKTKHLKNRLLDFFCYLMLVKNLKFLVQFSHEILEHRNRPCFFPGG